MPSLSNIRERALKQALDRRAAVLEKHADTLDALQDRRSLGLSLDEIARQRAALRYYETVFDRSNELISTIRKQNADIAADRAAHPLRPAARRQQFDKAAILGLLERERGRTAALSRGALARAQAIAASRSKLDLRSAYRKSGTPMSDDASFRGEASFYYLS